MFGTTCPRGRCGQSILHGVPEAHWILLFATHMLFWAHGILLFTLTEMVLVLSPYVLSSSPEVVEWGRSLGRTSQATKPCPLPPQAAIQHIFQAKGPQNYNSTHSPKHLPSPCFAPASGSLCVLCWWHCLALQKACRCFYSCTMFQAWSHEALKCFLCF